MQKFYKFYKILSDKEKLEIIRNASSAFAKFLESLKIDWQNDPETKDTPMRVAKTYVNDLLSGRFTQKPDIRVFEVMEIDNLVLKIFGPITIKSICIHHCMPFIGSVIIGINSADKKEKSILGINKYMEICNWYASRGQIQEKLGNDILNELIKSHKGLEIAIFIKAQHTCFSSKKEGECSGRLYTVHTTNNFQNYDTFISSCMKMV
ncbi:MAG: GTP cyclohydrolase I [Rickettsiaceae bacterium H1]|nr:GTP cyclohydrolase I [Rickettsiaceae bacterium H1]